jgi:hypothetical protein
MNKYLILLTLLCYSCTSSTSEYKINKDVCKNLNSKSVIIDVSHFLSYHLNDNAQNLLLDKNTNKYECLLNSLNIEDKAVIGHIILTKLLEPNNDNFKYEYIYDNDKIIKTIYSINNLRWSYREKDSLNIIENYNSKRLINYWTTKVKQSNNLR